MPRAVKDSKLDSRAARAKLKPSGKPYWRALDPELHVGYRKGKTGGRWVARVYLGAQQYKVETIGTADDNADADGRAVLDWRQAQAEAREAQARILRKQSGSEDTAAPYTVADALDDHIAWLAKHRKPTAVRDARSAKRVHIDPVLGKLELAKLTTKTLSQWHEGLAEQPRRLRTRPGAEQRYRELADDPESVRRRRDTANRIRTILFAALNHAFHASKIQSDAAWRKVKPFRQTAAARVHYLQLDECRRLLNACAPDFRNLVRGALATGARYGELSRADVRDFNADASALLIRESKGGKPRWIPLDDEGAKFLASITAGRAPSEPLFARADGDRWGQSHQTRPLRIACRAARLEPCKFHSLRHTYASLRVMAGMPLIAVANVLGHSTTRMVEKHYGHLSPSYIREAVKATALDLGPIETKVTPLKAG
jgi:integrase